MESSMIRAADFIVLALFLIFVSVTIFYVIRDNKYKKFLKNEISKVKIGQTYKFQIYDINPFNRPVFYATVVDIKEGYCKIEYRDKSIKTLTLQRLVMDWKFVN